MPLDMVKDQENDLADLLRGDAALLDASKKGELDRVSKRSACMPAQLGYVLMKVCPTLAGYDVVCSNHCPISV